VHVLIFFPLRFFTLLLCFTISQTSNTAGTMEYSKPAFGRFSLANLDGDYFLRPDRILGAFFIDTDKVVESYDVNSADLIRSEIARNMEVERSLSRYQAVRTSNDMRIDQFFQDIASLNAASSSSSAASSSSSSSNANGVHRNWNFLGPHVSSRISPMHIISAATNYSSPSSTPPSTTSESGLQANGGRGGGMVRGFRRNVEKEEAEEDITVMEEDSVSEVKNDDEEEEVKVTNTEVKKTGIIVKPTKFDGGGGGGGGGVSGGGGGGGGTAASVESSIVSIETPLTPPPQLNFKFMPPPPLTKQSYQVEDQTPGNQVGSGAVEVVVVTIPVSNDMLPSSSPTRVSPLPTPKSEASASSHVSSSSPLNSDIIFSEQSRSESSEESDGHYQGPLWPPRQIRQPPLVTETEGCGNVLNREIPPLLPIVAWNSTTGSDEMPAPSSSASSCTYPSANSTHNNAPLNHLAHEQDGDVTDGERMWL
jgi:hypothetical protein